MVLLVEGKVDKFALKLRIEKTKVETHIIIWRQKFLGSCKKDTFLGKSFLKNRKSRFFLKTGNILK